MADRGSAILRWLSPGMALLAILAALYGGEMVVAGRFAAVAALALLVFVDIREKRLQFMTSPLFLLAALIIVFFSLVPGIWGRSLLPWNPKYLTIYVRDITTYVGSDTEGIVIAFGAICLGLYFFSSRHWRSAENGPEGITIKPVKYLPMLLVIFVLLVSVFNGALYYFNTSGDSPPYLYSQVRFLTPPLIAFSLFYMVRTAIGRGPMAGIAVAVTAVAAITVLLYVHEGKLAIFIACTLALYAARLRNPRPFPLFLAAAATLMAGIFMIQAVQAIRLPNKSVIAPVNAKERSGQFEWSGVSAKFQQVLIWKAVWRQTETGYCLGNVLRTHRNERFDVSRQLFWLKGLVPRLLWPGKPNLSLGGEYAARYCRLHVKTSALKGHSASITLLGQPMIHGGWAGLVFHVGLLLAALAAIERINADPVALPGVLSAALLPWLIDFDQDFALYVANAVKFTLAMMVLYLPALLIERRRVIQR